MRASPVCARMCIVCPAIVHTQTHYNLVSSDNSCIFSNIKDQHTHRVKSTSVSVRANTSQRAVMIRGRWTGEYVCYLSCLSSQTCDKVSCYGHLHSPPPWRKVKETEDMPHTAEKTWKTHHSCLNGQTSKRQMPTDHHRSFPKPSERPCCLYNHQETDLNNKTPHKCLTTDSCRVWH